MAAQQFESVEDMIKAYVPEQAMPEVWRVLYGGTPKYLLVHLFLIFGIVISLIAVSYTHLTLPTILRV